MYCLCRTVRYIKALLSYAKAHHSFVCFFFCFPPSPFLLVTNTMNFYAMYVRQRRSKQKMRRKKTRYFSNNINYAKLLFPFNLWRCKNNIFTFFLPSLFFYCVNYLHLKNLSLKTALLVNEENLIFQQKNEWMNEGKV